MKKEYFEKLKDPRWQKKRLEALEHADWACSVCGDSESTLHVHHRAYFKGREPWEYDFTQLEVLCEECHEGEHESDDVLLLAASMVPIECYMSREVWAYMIYGDLGIEMPFDNKLQKAAYGIGANLQSQLHDFLKAHIEEIGLPSPEINENKESD